MKIIRHFERPEEFWDHVRKEPTVPRPDYRSISGDLNFTGTNSYDEALAFAEKGWPEGAEKIKTAVAHLTAKIGTALKDLMPCYDVVGESPDVGLFLSGEPEHMIKFEPGEGNTRIVKMVFNNCYSGGVSGDVAARRGALAVALIDSLERIGIRVEVIGTVEVRKSFASESSNSYFRLSVKVKDASEPTNLDRLAFSLVNPSFLRRLYFRTLELEPKEVGDYFNCGAGYGFPGDVPKESQGDIYFPAMQYDDPDYESDQKAVAKSLEILKGLGVELKEDI